jgi:SAM-dependent methyltransferase
LLREAGVARQHVVEFAPGMGRTAALVLDHAPAGYIGVDADPQAARLIDRIVSRKGRAIAAQAAVSGLPDQSADVVLAEGVLTIRSEQGKEDIVAEGVRLLRPGGRYVLHELALRTEAAAAGSQIRSALAHAMHVHARPKTVREWESLLTAAGLQVQMVRTSPRFGLALGGRAGCSMRPRTTPAPRGVPPAASAPRCAPRRTVPAP